MINSLNDGELKELLEDSFKKIKSSADQDSKKLSDLNTTLNWILTFSTVFFVFYTRTNFLPTNTFEIVLFKASKFSFLSLALILIIHKVFYVRYEDFKGGYLASLYTHLIDLKFNLSSIKPKIAKMLPIESYQFINAFRDGEFLYHPSRGVSIQNLKKLDCKIKRCGNWLKVTYWIGLIIFFVSFFMISYVLIR